MTNDNQLNIFAQEPRRDPLAFLSRADFSLTNKGIALVDRSHFSVREFSFNKQESDLLYELDDPEDQDESEALEGKFKALNRLTGKVLAEYRLDATTTREGVVLPSRFSGTLPRLYDFPGKLNFRATFLGEVTNVQALRATVDLLPDLHGEVTVQDRRLKGRSGKYWRREGTYKLENARWIIETNHPTIQAALAVKPWRTTVGPSNRKEKQFLSVVGLFVLLLAPAVAFIVLAARRRKKLNTIV